MPNSSLLDVMKDTPITPSPADARFIRTLLPMACDGIGPSETCLNLLRGAHRAKFPLDLFANRRRTVERRVPMHLAMPAPLNRLPYRWTADIASRRIEHMFLNAITPEDIAYLWPTVSLEMHRKLKARGVPIVLEGINTRMASARKILDAAYEDFGMSPSHGITQERIDEEEEKYALADAIFAPNSHVETALKGTALEAGILASSYGVDTTRASPDRDTYKKEGPLTFMFCGYACVRKGVHLLLDAWKTMPAGHKLQFVGHVEPAIAERYRDLLASESIELVGFVDDVHPWFAQADVFVFPSLEEGGPQVVYEAALHGLPIVASPMGAGRLEHLPGALVCLDPRDKTAFGQAMGDLADSADLRERLGREARRLVAQFDWNVVGAERAQKLQSFFADSKSFFAHPTSDAP